MGLDVSVGRGIKVLQDEGQRPIQVVADLTVDETAARPLVELSI